VQAIQLDHPDKPGDDQHVLVRFSSRLTVPRSDGNRTFAEAPGWGFGARVSSRSRGAVSSPPKPVSEFAPTKLKQAWGHADTARVRDPRGWMRTWQVSFC